MRIHTAGTVRRLSICVFIVMTIAVSGCQGDKHPLSPSTSTAGSGMFGVGLYDVDAKTFRSIPTSHPVSQPRWLTDGQTFVGFDTQTRDVEIFDLDGQSKGIISSDENVDVHTSHHGAIILNRRNTKTLAAFDAATLTESPFPALPGANSGAAFSPDGTRIAYVNKDASRKALVLANASGADPRILISETSADRDIGVGDASWSPDGQWLLVSTSVCPRGPDPECQTSTAMGHEVVDLSGHVVWNRESPTFSVERWGGPARLLIDLPAATPEKGQFGTRQALISIPDGTQTLAPDIVHPNSELSPDGRIVLDPLDALYTCALTNIETSERLVEGGCGLENWTTDSKQVLLWGTACSGPPLVKSQQCVDGRLQRPIPTPTATIDLSSGHRYTPGPTCDVASARRSPLTPPASTPVPADNVPTPEYYAALKRFVRSRFKVTYTACMPTKTGNEQQTVTWYKDGANVNRFDLRVVMGTDTSFDLTYIENGEHFVVCGTDLGDYLKASFDRLDGVDAPQLEQFYDAIKPFREYGNACIQDDHHKLVFDAAFEVPSEGNPLRSAGVRDPREIDLAKLDANDVRAFGSNPTLGTRTIAGRTATCFGNAFGEHCFGDDGILLSSSGGGSIEASEATNDVQQTDLDPPFELKTEIPRCFPQDAVPTEPVGAVSTAVSQQDFASAVKIATLGLNDLPCSWSSASSTGGGGSGCAGCCDGQPGHETDGTFENRADFDVSETLGETSLVIDHLEQRVTYDPRGRLGASLTRIEAYWDSCRTHTFQDSHGDQITVHAQRLEAPAYGDQSDVYLLTFNHNAYGDYVLTYIRHANVLSLLVYYDGALGVRDPDRDRAVQAAAAIAKKADAKLAELSTQLP